MIDIIKYKVTAIAVLRIGITHNMLLKHLSMNMFRNMCDKRKEVFKIEKVEEVEDTNVILYPVDHSYRMSGYLLTEEEMKNLIDEVRRDAINSVLDANIPHIC